MRITIHNQAGLHSFLSSHAGNNLVRVPSTSGEENEDVLMGCVLCSDPVSIAPPLRYVQLIVRASGEDYSGVVHFEAESERVFEGLSNRVYALIEGRKKQYEWLPLKKNLIGHVVDKNTGEAVVSVTDRDTDGKSLSVLSRRVCIGGYGAKPCKIPDRETSFLDSFSLLEGCANHFVKEIYRLNNQSKGMRNPDTVYLNPLI